MSGENPPTRPAVSRRDFLAESAAAATFTIDPRHVVGGAAQRGLAAIG